MGLRGKIGVYGRSIGGLATTHLADKVDLIIADRTLYDFDILADRKFHSSYSKFCLESELANGLPLITRMSLIKEEIHAIK